MSGGAITDNRYDLDRLNDWATEIRREMASEYTEEAVKPDLEWLADLLGDLYECLYATDRTLSGDSGAQRTIDAVAKFKKKYFTGTGPSEADLINLETYAGIVLHKCRRLRGKE